MNETIKRIVNKYLADDLTEEESELLMEWLDDAEHKKIFEEYIRLDGAINKSLHSFDALEAYQKAIPSETKVVTFRYENVFKYAAILMSLVGIGYMCYLQLNTPDPTNSGLKVVDKPVLLKKSNGEIVQIDIEKNQDYKEGGNIIWRQEKNKIIYEDQLATNVVYNEVVVPEGKRFKVVLSDGTLVHLNSGTTFKYPVDFVANKNRQVYLKGEAFFDVKRDEEKLFMVEVDQMNIRVLGTQFNVAMFPEDQEVNTVLVEGSVALYATGKEKNGVKLTPNQKGVFQKGNKKITVSDVDVSDHISWMKGRLIFKKTAFKKIIKKLERFYNVKIVNNYPELDNHEFTGVFDTEEESILDVLEVIKNYSPIEWHLKDNKIVITSQREIE